MGAVSWKTGWPGTTPAANHPGWPGGRRVYRRVAFRLRSRNNTTPRARDLQLKSTVAGRRRRVPVQRGQYAMLAVAAIDAMSELQPRRAWPEVAPRRAMADASPRR
jgi:hypothetical protein